MWTERLKAIVCMYIVHRRVIVDNKGEFHFVFSVFFFEISSIYIYIYIYILIVKK